MAIREFHLQRTGLRGFAVDFRTEDGERIRKRVAFFTDSESKKAALKLARVKEGEILAAVRNGEYTAKENAAQTFATLVKDFQDEYGSKRRSDYYHFTAIPLVKHFGGTRLARIDRAAVEGYISQRTEMVKPSTLRKELAVLATVLKWARTRKRMKHDPLEGISRPREPRGRTAYIPREDWPRVLDSAPPWLRPMMALALWTGLRLKEVVSVTWDDIDTAKRILNATEDGKTGWRPVPLCPEALAVLASIPRRVRSRFVFTDSEGADYTDAKARNRITCNAAAVLARAGFPDCTFHSLRHSCASAMVAAGVPLYQVGQVLGHRDPSTTARYAHLAPGALHAAVAVLSLGNAMDKNEAGAPQGATDEAVSV